MWWNDPQNIPWLATIKLWITPTLSSSKSSNSLCTPPPPPRTIWLGQKFSLFQEVAFANGEKRVGLKYLNPGWVSLVNISVLYKHCPVSKDYSQKVLPVSLKFAISKQNRTRCDPSQIFTLKGEGINFGTAR